MTGTQPRANARNDHTAQVDVEPPDTESWPIGHTLEQELRSDAFASRGWSRLVNATIYLTGLVDGRHTGIFATERAETFTRLAGFASVVKAAVQWFRLGAPALPKFVLEAQKYLADEPHNQPVPDLGDSTPPVFRSGPVVFLKGARGTTGRRHAVATFKDQLTRTLNSITAEDLHTQQAAFRELAPDDRILASSDILAMNMTHRFIYALGSGFCADMLREQRFMWPDSRDLLKRLSAAMADVLDDAELSAEPAQTRADRLEQVAERLISAGFEVLGVSVEKDFFRDRRGNVSR